MAEDNTKTLTERWWDWRIYLKLIWQNINIYDIENFLQIIEQKFSKVGK